MKRPCFIKALSSPFSIPSLLALELLANLMEQFCNNGFLLFKIPHLLKLGEKRQSSGLSATNSFKLTQLGEVRR